MQFGEGIVNTDWGLGPVLGIICAGACPF